jgi:hypothetical protein
MFYRWLIAADIIEVVLGIAILVQAIHGHDWLSSLLGAVLFGDVARRNYLRWKARSSKERTNQRSRTNDTGFCGPDHSIRDKTCEGGISAPTTLRLWRIPVSFFAGLVAYIGLFVGLRSILPYYEFNYRSGLPHERWARLGG